MIALPEQPSGADLARAIAVAATEKGVSPAVFARPLSPHPQTWLFQLEVALAPKHWTVERVRALLAGEPVPTAPTQGRKRGPRVREAVVLPEVERVDEANLPPVVYRDPCFHCGVRADIGCGCHARFGWERA